MLTPLVMSADPLNPSYGCGPVDWGCLTSESMARMMASTIKNLGDFIADMITNSFGGTIGQGSWDVAHGQFLFWVSVMLPVVMIIALVQIGIAMIVQDWHRMGRTAIGAILAVPFSAISVWGMQQASGVTDSVTTDLTSTIQGSGLSTALLKIMGLAMVPSQATDSIMAAATMNATGVPNQLMLLGAASSQSVGEYVLALMIVGLMAIASLFLFIAMAIRTFGLLVLAALAPVGLMMLGQAKLGAWAQRWMSLSVGLLLAKPLAAGVLLLSVQLTSSTPNLGFMLVCAGAIVAAAFSPLWATKLVSFAGAEVGTALHRRFSIREQTSRVSAAAAPARAAVRVIKVGS